MHKLTEQYIAEIKKYDDFKLKMEVLIKELLVQGKINFHKIESRIKSSNGLDEKISRKGDKYKSLSEITDLVGVRVITYFEDEVDKVANIIESDFELDQDNSIDKRQLDNDRFGYKSLHYVVSLNAQRKGLTEYKRFKEIKLEIQIRSILQHAWAEIEHDIGYKGENAIPDIYKRNFYRVAALLETADIEFVNMRNGLVDYESTVAEKIEFHPEDVEINAASLKAFINNNPLVSELDKAISSESKHPLSEDGHSLVDNRDVDRLIYLKIRTIKDLENAIEENKNVIPKFAKHWLNSGLGSLPKGISIFYLAYVLAGKKQDKEFADNYMKSHIYFDNQPHEVDAKRLIEVYKKAMLNFALG